MALELIWSDYRVYEWFWMCMVNISIVNGVHKSAKKYSRVISTLSFMDISWYPPKKEQHIRPYVCGGSMNLYQWDLRRSTDVDDDWIRKELDNFIKQTAVLHCFTLFFHQIQLPLSEISGIRNKVVTFQQGIWHMGTPKKHPGMRANSGASSTSGGTFQQG